MSITDKRRASWLGRLFTHRILGLPLFLLVMWVVFRLVTDVSAPFVGWVDDLVRGPVSRWITFPEFASTMRAVLSSLPVATSLPFGENATARTQCGG